MIPFDAPKDYSDMLNKIAIFTFASAFIFTIIISSSSPLVKSFFEQFDIKVNFAGIEGIPIAYLVPPLIIAILARIFKLHDRISDCFQIRHSYDINEILIPLAGGVGIPTNLVLIDKLKANRDNLMQNVFYKYASSTDPKIDKHLIIMALDKWTWFWILIELVVIGFISLIALYILGAYKNAAIMATGISIGIIVTSFIRRACSTNAHAEVNEILSDTTRRNEVKAIFDAL